MLIIYSSGKQTTVIGHLLASLVSFAPFSRVIVRRTPAEIIGYFTNDLVTNDLPNGIGRINGWNLWILLLDELVV